MLYFISTLFILMAIFCSASGIYVLYLNHTERLNKISFLICTALSCLSYGIQRSWTASDRYKAVNWRRFSEAASLMVFALLLDFVLTVTIKEMIQKNIWMQFLLYLPTLILIYVMSLSEHLSYPIYHYTMTPLGWVNTSNVSPFILICN